LSLRVDLKSKSHAIINNVTTFDTLILAQNAPECY
jgi:hypothetical protein